MSVMVRPRLDIERLSDPESRESAVVDLLGEIIEYYRYVGPEGDGYGFLRVAEAFGRCIGRLYGFDGDELMVIMDEKIDESFFNVDSEPYRSKISGAMVSGLMDVDRNDLAADIFRLGVRDETVQNDLLRQLLEADPEIAKPKLALSVDEC